MSTSQLSVKTVTLLGAMPSAGTYTGGIFRYNNHLWFDDGTTIWPIDQQANFSIATASEAISANAFVNLYSNAGVFAMRNANATTYGREANGFVKVAVSSGATGVAYGPGTVNTGLSSLVPGPLWLSTTNGLGTATVPTGSGNVVQSLGYPKSPTEIQFEPNTPITRA